MKTLIFIIALMFASISFAGNSVGTMGAAIKIKENIATSSK